ncbi:MAG: branched-chain amino acid ABC transporter permease, partial [Pseudomonadota bacterium]
IVVIGGIGTLEGPIIGTLVFFALRETLADFGTIYLMVLGAVAIVVMLFAPKGVWGLLRERFDLELFPLSYRVRSVEPAGEVRADPSPKAPHGRGP